MALGSLNSIIGPNIGIFVIILSILLVGAIVIGIIALFKKGKNTDFVNNLKNLITIKNSGIKDKTNNKTITLKENTDLSLESGSFYVNNNGYNTVAFTSSPWTGGVKCKECDNGKNADFVNNLKNLITIKNSSIKPKTNNKTIALKEHTDLSLEEGSFYVNNNGYNTVAFESSPWTNGNKCKAC